MTSEEKSVYLRTTSDEGNKRFVIGSSLIDGFDETDSLHIDWISGLRIDQKLQKSYEMDREELYIESI